MKRTKNIKWDEGLTAEEAACFTAPMRHKRWEELNENVSNIRSALRTSQYNRVQ